MPKRAEGPGKGKLVITADLITLHRAGLVIRDLGTSSNGQTGLLDNILNGHFSLDAETDAKAVSDALLGFVIIPDDNG